MNLFDKNGIVGMAWHSSSFCCRKMTGKNFAADDVFIPRDRYADVMISNKNNIKIITVLDIFLKSVRHAFFSPLTLPSSYA